MSKSDTTAATAALSLFVLVTLPPMRKWTDPNARVYWQVEVKDKTGTRYSNTYRVTDRDRAKALAAKIARDLKIGIQVTEPPAVTEAPRGAIDLDAGDLNDILPGEAGSAEDGESIPF